MLSKKMVKALNEQINKEIYSAYLYMSMSSYSDSIGLKGFANWFMVQYQEEMEHAMRFYNYVQEQGEQVTLMAIDQPETKFASPLALFEKTLEHEKYVTKRINTLVDQAMKENDHATRIFLQWFVTEQVEEEANASDIIGKLKLVGKDSSGLLMVDQELAARTFTPSLGKGEE
ncbi:MAG: ferritin [Gemmatimonadota bacterium]|nr:MAG: ferritin [Gemmatimonadota bacterium]